MSILRGHFAVMLIVSMPDGVDADRLRGKLEPIVADLGLEAVAINPVAEVDPAAAAATHVLTVYGADHPGIVHAVATALADRGVNVTDLETRLTGEAGAPLYVMLIEISVPAGDEVEVETALRAVGERAEVEVSLRPLEAEAL